MGQHLTKKHRIALFIGLPDGEVMAKHLTRDLTRTLTRTPTIHCFLCAVATQGCVASYICHVRPLPFGEAG